VNICSTLAFAAGAGDGGFSPNETETTDLDNLQHLDRFEF